MQMVGTMLGNRYKLIEKIGEGGMAVVYKAKCTILNRFVAIKILKPEYSNNEEFMEKFRREALATASFSHSNIVNIYDVGSEGNINYIVMELVDGKTLKEYIRENAPLSTDTTLKISIQIAKALECAHKNKIIHRDIKPHNILINEDEVVKVTDFGIAKATSSDTITHTNKVIGSAHYFSPEQAKGKIVDNRTDIYSFGIVIYEMLTGRVPFDGESAVAVALKHIQDTIIPPKVLVPEVPDNLNNLVIKATQKEVIKRYNNVTEMLIDLMRIENNNKYVVTPSNMDNDYTTVMDATQIQNTMYASNLGKKLADNTMDGEDDGEDDDDDDDYDEDYDDKKTKTSTWKKILIVGGAVLLTILLGVFVGTSVYNKGDKNVAEEELKVPKVVGLTADEAKSAVENLGLTYVVLGEEASDKPAGTIIAVFPAEGTTVKKESEVGVRVSTGPGEVEVPSVVGLGKSIAQDHIVNQELKVGNISEDYSDQMSEGTVISTNPGASTKVKKGTAVDIVVSKGPRERKTTVPDLMGITIKDAEKVLTGAKLKLGSTTAVVTDDKSKDEKIFYQTEAAHTLIPEGKEISVNYYQYKDPDEGKVVVPNFIGKTVKDAQSAAEEAGLNIIVSGDKKGLIISQDVAEGQKVAKGSKINLTTKVEEPSTEEDQGKPDKKGEH